MATAMTCRAHPAGLLPWVVCAGALWLAPPDVSRVDAQETTAVQSPRSAVASTPPPAPRVYRLDRSEEDWSFLADPAQRDDAWDRWKYVPLRRLGWFVSFGGEGRFFYERYRNHSWGAGPQDGNGYVLSRALGHGDFHLGSRVRAFVELRSGLIGGRQGGPRPPDRDDLDLGQGWIGVSGGTNRRSWDLRVGRQELSYGEGALLAIRELNVRRPFDGARARVATSAWRLDAFAARPATIRRGVFDDVSDSRQLLWGLYATRTVARPARVEELGLYYLGLDRKQAVFDQGRGRDLRHTAGLTAKVRTGALSHAVEATVQWGTFGTGPIRAWKYAHAITRAWPEARFRPSAGLNVAVSSGDRNAATSALQTFYPLFPKGLYYGHIDSSGSLNAIVLHPHLTLRPASSVTLQTDTFFFWRQSLGDGLYSQPGPLLRSGIDVPGRYVGWLQDVELSLQVDRHLTFHLLTTYYGVGPFLRASTPSGKDDLYVGLKATYRF